MSEKVLDEETWKIEAQAVLNDIRDHVKSAELSKNLSSNNQKIYLNLTTLENERCCVELSGHGFRLVGKSHDTVNIEGGQYFETPYSLLNQISSNFCMSFGNALMDKLHMLEQD